MPAVKLILTMMGIKLRFSKKFLKKSMFFILFALLLGIVVIHNANSTIHKNAEGKLYTEVDSIPKNKVALLLGTGKYLKESVFSIQSGGSSSSFQGSEGGFYPYQRR